MPTAQFWAFWLATAAGWATMEALDHYWVVPLNAKFYGVTGHPTFHNTSPLIFMVVFFVQCAAAVGTWHAVLRVLTTQHECPRSRCR